MAIVLTNNAKFTPYSFEEQLKPLAMATAEHRAIEEGLAELGSKAELMRKYANEEPNADWAKAYNQYAAELEQSASDLAKYGLGPTNRSSMLGLKRRYSSAVSPIEEGAKKLEEYYKIMRSNPNNIYRNNGVITMSDVLNNTVDMSYLDEKTIMAESAIGAKAAGQDKLQSVLNNKGTLEQGISAANRAIEEYRNKYLNSVGLSEFNQANQDRINKAIELGTQGALSDIIKDGRAEARALEALELQKDQRRLAWANYNLNAQKAKTEEDLALAKAGYTRDKDGKVVKVNDISKLAEELATIRPWNDNVTTDTSKAIVLKSLKQGMTLDGTGTLSQTYTGKYFKNPLKIYEDAIEYAKKNPKTKLVKYSIDFPNVVDISLENAYKKMKEKYGVSKILSKKQYDQLVELGYSSKSSFYDFRNQLLPRINNVEKLYNPISINMANYSYANSVAIPTLNSRKDNFKGTAYEYKEGTVGDMLDYDDLPTDSKIADVAYSASVSSKIILRYENGTTIAVDPGIFGDTFSELVRSYHNKISSTSDINTKDYYQKLATIEIGNLFNNYRKVKSKTDSEI